ncbi:MAG: hypothetical protein ACTSPQ_15405 [Candidatus Helarchaeota archaeon]
MQDYENSSNIKILVEFTSTILEIKDKIEETSEFIKKIETILKAINALQYFSTCQFLSSVVQPFEKWANMLEDFNKLLEKINSILEIFEPFREFVEQYEDLYEIETLIQELEILDWIFLDKDILYRLHYCINNGDRAGALKVIREIKYYKDMISQNDYDGIVADFKDKINKIDQLI